MARRHLIPPAVKPRTRYGLRPRFALEILGDDKTVLCSGVASEWWLFRILRQVAKERRELLWFEAGGCPLTPRSLAALNVYLRTAAMRFFRSKRFDDGRELIGHGEWCRFCRMLGLVFDGKDTGPKPQRPERHAGFAVVKFAPASVNRAEVLDAFASQSTRRFLL